MPDSPLNGAERALQHSFRKFWIFNSLAMVCAVILTHFAIDPLPVLPPRPEAQRQLTYRPVKLPPGKSPWRLAGAWEMRADDPRLAGASGLVIEGNHFLAVGDRGAAMRFTDPSDPQPTIWFADLREGPGEWGRKRARDAESLLRDPKGRGWWIGYEQRHSLWLYEPSFGRALERIDLVPSNWRDNRGAEALLVREGKLLVLAENGRDAVRMGSRGRKMLRLHSDADVADAAVAPDGSAWVLLRTKGLSGIEQSIAPLQPTHDGYRTGPAWPVPKAAFDNYEGMAIAALPDGRWRFWLISDDGHRIMARTLLVALDLDLSTRHKKSPAQSTGPSKKR